MRSGRPVRVRPPCRSPRPARRAARFRDGQCAIVRASTPNAGARVPLRRLLATALFLAAPAFAAGPGPTVIVDIHARGAAGVAALKRADGVRWSAELGNGLLLGVAPDALDGWLARDGVRAGPSPLAFEEVVVRDHVCTHVDEHTPALAVVGGYEIVRASPFEALATRGAAVAGEPLPADGVVARELRNDVRAAPARGADPFVAGIVARVDAQRWFDTMSALAAFDRNSFSPALPTARDWLLARFGDAGLATETFPFQVTSGSCSGTIPPAVTRENPIGMHVGSVFPDEWIVVGAHYDSRNNVRCDGTANPQPGANDNASGCAGVIELARAFQGVPTARTLVFMCFAGEEQGLQGSRRYVESLQAAGTIGRVRHMVNLDMIGHAVNDNLDTRIETTATHAAVLPQYAAAAATYAPELNLITSTSTQAYSDHWYFLNAGVPGAFTWENGASSYPHYHQATDLPGNMLRARELAGGILKMDAAVIAELAGPGALFVDGFED
jgi:hypothetical protein